MIMLLDGAMCVQRMKVKNVALVKVHQAPVNMICGASKSVEKDYIHGQVYLSGLMVQVSF